MVASHSSFSFSFGDFFKYSPDQSQAKKEIASHLKRYWASSMREQILRHVRDVNGTGLQPIVRDAIIEYLE